MATSRDVLQNLRNRIDTAETFWMAFAEAATQSYDEALKTQTAALKQSEINVQLSTVDVWKVLNLLLVGVVGPWAPELLAPVEKVAGAATKYISGKVFFVEDLTAVWTSRALSNIAPDVKSHLKDTALEMMKDKVNGAQTKGSFDPVVDETLIYASRLKEGIGKRAGLLKLAMDEVIERADAWPLAAAQAMFNGFTNFCPFLTDMPQDTGDAFKKTFRDQSELAMWVAWAVVRDQEYWRGKQYDPGFFGNGYHGLEVRRAMSPILNRLLALQVPPDDVSTVENAYAGGYTYRVIDMLKLIAWAKRGVKPQNWKSSPSQEICRKVDPGVLRIRIQENSCRVQE